MDTSDSGVVTVDIGKTCCLGIVQCEVNPGVLAATRMITTAISSRKVERVCLS